MVEVLAPLCTPMASGWEVCSHGRFLIDACSSGDPFCSLRRSGAWTHFNLGNWRLAEARPKPPTVAYLCIQLMHAWRALPPASKRG